MCGKAKVGRRRKTTARASFVFLYFSLFKKFCITCKMRARLNLFASKASRKREGNFHMNLTHISLQVM